MFTIAFITPFQSSISYVFQVEIKIERVSIWYITRPIPMIFCVTWLCLENKN